MSLKNEPITVTDSTRWVWTPRPYLGVGTIRRYDSEAEGELNSLIRREPPILAVTLCFLWLAAAVHRLKMV